MVENVRLRTDEYELIAAQEGNYILVVIYDGKLVTKCTMEEVKEL